MLREDLECLLGKMIKGDITPVVYELLKDSPHKEELRALLSTRGETTNVSITDTVSSTQKDSDRRPNLAEWLSQSGQPFSL